jgi:selenocysteine lyase/cysteine desulfurase
VLEQLLEWGVGNIAATLAAKVKRIEQETSALGLALTTQGRHAPHMLGLKLPATSLSDAAARLQQRRVYAAVRGPAIRISPHVYTADDDIDRLIDALKGLAT